MQPKHIATALIFLTIIGTAQAATYYCDPVTGNTTTGNGSESNPWGSLQSIDETGFFDNETIVGGDTVKLLSGYHGMFAHSTYGVTREGLITIEAADGAIPQLSKIIIKYAENWKFKGLHISPEFAGPVEEGTGAIIYGYGNYHIIIEDCNIFIVNDASDWTAYEWREIAQNGIDIRSPADSTFINNTIRNVKYGFTGIGGNNLVQGNLVDGFSIDALTSLNGPNTIVEDNIFINSYDDEATGTHTDGIQVFPTNDLPTEKYDNITIRRNYINARTDPNRDPDTLGGLQGIFIESTDYFSGVIEDNVILATNTGHGITVQNAGGPKGLQILNNTILLPYGITNGDNHGPGIRITAEADNITVKNNIANNFPLPDDYPGKNFVVENNLDVSVYRDMGDDDYVGLFKDYPNHDMRLLMSSKACNGNITREPYLTTGSMVGALDCILNTCSKAGDCDDENPCTTDSCSEGQCQYSFNSDSCDDGIECTTSDHCNNGICSDVTPDSSICLSIYPECTSATCDAQQGCINFSPTDCRIPNVPNDFAAYWRFEFDTKDITEINNGTFIGGTETYEPGILGQAIRLNGNEQYIDVGDGTTKITGPITISAWAKTDTTSTRQAIIGRGSYDTSQVHHQYNLWFNLPSGYIRSEISNGLTKFKVNTDPYFVQSNTWYHAVSVWDGSKMHLYVNGLLVDSIDAPLANLNDKTDNTLIGTKGAYTYWFDGLLDEIMLYSRALSTAEIEQIYASQSSNPPEPECVDMPTLLEHVEQWKQGNIGMTTIMEKIGKWKSGEGC